MTKKEVEDRFIQDIADNKKLFIVSQYGYVVELSKSSVFYDQFISTYNYGNVFYSSIVSLYNQKPISIEVSTSLGSDPEFFFLDKKGNVVPSTMVIPPKTSGEVTIDGFQGEFNPPTHSCRAIEGSFLRDCILEANTYAKSVDAVLNFDVGHTISDDMWKKVPVSLKRFGCNPTLNVHEGKFKRVSGLREKFRAGGGHIHIGTSKAESSDPDLIALMDIIVGNTAVLVDRDPNNARRREIYGRAGEYRIKSYGLEYRVLSNFWLKDYILWSMSAGLMRNALGIYRAKLAKDLIARFNMKKVRDAINFNDSKLAMENYLILVEFFKEKTIISNTALSIKNIDKVTKWLSSKDPIKKVVSDKITDQITGWQTKDIGFERFIDDLEL